MFGFIATPLKKVKKYIISNKKLYLLSIVVAVVGVALGVYMVLGEFMDAELYTTTDLELSEIILAERGFFELFFKNVWSLVLPFVLIFLLFTNNYTKFLSFFYLGYQGILLGASVASLIQESGLAGALNSLLVVIPINFINFFVIISWLVTCYKRLSVARLQRLSFKASLKLFFPQFLGCFLGALFAGLVYGLIYPLLLRSVIVVNA